MTTAMRHGVALQFEADLCDTFSMFDISVIRRLLAGLAMLGLLLAPSAGFAHSAMDHMPSTAMADDGGSRCPDMGTSDCQKCALTASCMAQCLQNLAHEQTFAPVAGPGATRVVLLLEDTIAGLVHSPPRRPPIV